MSYKRLLLSLEYSGSFFLFLQGRLPTWCQRWLFLAQIIIWLGNCTLSSWEVVLNLILMRAKTSFSHDMERRKYQMLQHPDKTYPSTHISPFGVTEMDCNRDGSFTQFYPLTSCEDLPNYKNLLMLFWCLHRLQKSFLA